MLYLSKNSNELKLLKLSFNSTEMPSFQLLLFLLVSHLYLYTFYLRKKMQDFYLKKGFFTTSDRKVANSAISLAGKSSISNFGNNPSL